ncbi:hypothetical protein [Streptomyces sp. NBC_00233]|uniref:hypothetical protein n=1 Tax=Streptomyces sp. NBC_00233 TaxID=2975686 RepID=UPI002253B2A2|nr:hypothetical protein [Streptomyces sp. NBC_00233]MCX5229673.1 hypothetical protein [Streptomyces sp. NBC_00233]
MARVYATASQYQQYTGQTPPENIEILLAGASRMLDRRIFRYCWYIVDSVTKLPTNPLVAEAFAEAVCAQAEWGDEIGDTTGAAGAGWGSMELGSAKLSRSVTAVSGSDAPGRQVADKVWDSLQSPDLTADIFVLGVVTS